MRIFCTAKDSKCENLLHCKRFSHFESFAVQKILTAKDSHIFPTKNNSGFDNLIGIYLTS